MIHEVANGDVVASDDPDRIDFAVLHGFLTHSYWAQDIPRDLVEKSVSNSCSMGLYTDELMIGFARAVTDYATFAYLGDVFVEETWRGRGFGLFISRCVVEHPRLQGLRRWILSTKDAHGVYAKLGFGPLANPDAIMTIHDPDIYRR